MSWEPGRPLLEKRGGVWRQQAYQMEAMDTRRLLTSSEIEKVDHFLTTKHLMLDSRPIVNGRRNRKPKQKKGGGVSC